jgi:hypothetical protein
MTPPPSSQLNYISNPSLELSVSSPVMKPSIKVKRQIPKETFEIFSEQTKIFHKKKGPYETLQGILLYHISDSRLSKKGDSVLPDAKGILYTQSRGSENGSGGPGKIHYV